jgi:hypothetical protein
VEELFSYGWPGIRKFFRKNLVAILYTLIFHLVVLITLILLQVEGLKKQQEAGIQLEFEEKTVEDLMEEEQMEVPAEWLEEVLRMREAASNRAVNLNAETGISEEISTDAYVQELLDQIEQARDQQDRERLEELQAILAAADYEPPAPAEEQDREGEYTGPTTITYEFVEEPKQRGRIHLTVPVYRCMGSGRVRVEILVAPDGSVADATVLEPIEGADRICFAEASLAAALSSRFRVDLDAPDRQRGVITYTFIAQ